MSTPVNGPVTCQLLPIWVGDQDTLEWGKPTALFHLVHDVADIAITPVNERYVDQPLGEIMIVAVDSLDARREIWKMSGRNKGSPPVTLISALGMSVAA